MLASMTTMDYLTFAILFLTIMSTIATILIQRPHLRRIWHDMYEFKEGTPTWVKNIGFMPLVMLLLTAVSTFATLSN